MNLSRIKFIAFYLPQFHEIPENNEWWGKGFTEWERLKKAKPIFEGHYQPRIPEKYYDLSDVSVMEWQSKIAIQYGIYGFCYYHYWFNGHKLLYKPLEQMLDNKDVDIPFCLSWANEPWTRAWDGKSKEILMPQKYGEEGDWVKHLEYLLPYFADIRYIKKEGKPVFLIYRTESYKRFDEMIEFWNKRLLEKGLNPLFIVEMLTSFQNRPRCKNSQAVVEFEPMLTIGGNKTFYTFIKQNFKRRYINYYKKKHTTYDYKKICSKIITRRINFKDKETFLGAFPDWDNTPRFRKLGTVFLNVSHEEFGNLLTNQIMKSKSEFLFINAWNEWTEGAYIEPDLKNKYKLLETIAYVHGKF